MVRQAHHDVAATATTSFESQLEKLETIVRKLENGDLTLEQSLKAFEEGIGLARKCEKMLKETKGKVEKLVQNESNEWKEETL
ncbi:MAG: exodeoxyribonuclease VII small subunit [Deltaproteobacteria bacterium]|nr:exodeoxyribonuclease VII small subunit [Deltaproteobacteria bacterium]